MKNDKTRKPTGTTKKETCTCIRTLGFYLVMIVLTLVIFETVFAAGGYLYLYLHSNFNDPEFDKDAFRILFLGESTVLGAGLKNRKDAFPFQVERILNNRSPALTIQCINKGVGGIETYAILRNLDKWMIRYKPHLVILMAGFVDNFSDCPYDFTGYMVLPIQKERPSKIKKLLSKSRTYRLYASFKDLFRISGVRDPTDGFRYMIRHDENERPWLPILPFYKKHIKNSLSEVILNLKLIIETVHFHQSEIWFAGYMQPNAQGCVNPLLKLIADETGIIYVGNYPNFDFQKDKRLFVDGWHPSGSGHKIIAENIVETIYKGKVLELLIQENHSVTGHNQDKLD